MTKQQRALEMVREQAELLSLARDAIIVRDLEDRILFWNRGAEMAYGWRSEEALGKVSHDLLRTKFPTDSEKIYKKLRTSGSSSGELIHMDRAGTQMVVESRWVILQNEGSGSVSILEINRDVSERKLVEERTIATNVLLEMFLKKSSRKESIAGLAKLIRDWSNCRCVGIRFLNREGAFPYEYSIGFSQKFINLESELPFGSDACVCHRIISRSPKALDKSLMTPGDSMQNNNVAEFMDRLSDDEKKNFKWNCFSYGFLSIAYIPIRFQGNIIGAIHLADERSDMVDVKRVEFLEMIAPLIGEAMQRFNLQEEIRESEMQLHRLSSQLVAAQESERKKVVRELHDGLGQSLTAIKFKVESFLMEMKARRSKPKLQSLAPIIPMIQECIHEIRRIHENLRPSIIDDLGIIATISWLCREFQHGNPSIMIRSKIEVKEQEIPEPLKMIFYRILQEALNNISRHSQANRISLSLKKVDGKIEISVKDNGKGFDPSNILSESIQEKRFGLASIKERSEQAGGTFHIRSIPGKGTSIEVQFPLKEK